jgi:hypothetical protein
MAWTALRDAPGAAATSEQNGVRLAPWAKRRSSDRRCSRRRPRARCSVIARAPPQGRCRAPDRAAPAVPPHARTCFARASFGALRGRWAADDQGRRINVDHPEARERPSRLSRIREPAHGRRGGSRAAPSRQRGKSRVAPRAAHRARGGREGRVEGGSMARTAG